MYIKNPRRARIVCDGEWGIAEGLVYDKAKVIDFDAYKKIKQLQETAHGMDFGFTYDPTTLINIVVDLKQKELWIYDEHYEKAMLTDDIVKMIKRKGYQNAEIVADSAEGRLIAEIKNKGIPKIRKSVKGKGSIMQGIQFIQGFDIYVHPSCEYVVEEFNTYTFEQDKEGNWLNKPIDKNNHLMDAMRYALEKYHIERAKPKKTTVKNTIRTLKSMGL